MKFSYTKITKQVYLENTDEYEDFGDEFEYEPSDEDLIEAITDCIYDDYLREKTELSLNTSFVMIEKEFIERFITDFDLVDKLTDIYENELKEWFEQEAMDFYNDNYN